MSTPRRFACAVGVMLGLAPAVAWAQGEPANRPAAQALFERASTLLDQHDYAAACPMLEEVLRLMPGKIGTMMAIGECYEGQKRVASAWIHYRDAAERAAAQNDVRAAAARAKVAALEPRVPKLRIQLDAVTKGLAGLEVKRDDTVVGVADWGDPIPVDPGQHVVVAQAPGQRSVRAVVQLKEGETKDAPLSLASSSSDDAPPPPRLDPAPASSAQRTAGLVVGAVGVAGLAAGGIMGVVTLL
jgi:hypothetical protein